jgi:hypothetical protein
VKQSVPRSIAGVKSTTDEVKQGVVLSNLRPRLTEKAAQAAECKGVEVKRTQVARLVKSQVLCLLQPMSTACEDACGLNGNYNSDADGVVI